MSAATATLRPTEPFPLPSGLSLARRLKLLLSFSRADLSVSPVDEWQLKSALLAFLRNPPLSLSLLQDSDLSVSRLPDLQKRRRDDPVASGILYVRDLSFLRPGNRTGDNEAEKMTPEQEEKKYSQWRSSLVEKLDGIDLNLKGVMYRMSVEIPASDDFTAMKKSWEDFYASELFSTRNPVRKIAKRPDTILVRGVPSRWFAETRISSKASTLVTHTIFSALGKIRTLNISNDDELEEKKDETNKGLISGLNCKVWVQFESYDDFHNAMKALCGRSLEKEGSRLKVNYDVTWDREGFFRNAQCEPAHNKLEETDAPVHGRKKHYTSRIESDHRKRFRD
ncbi:unnamed protein product [Triticum aestivum]|uniref:RRM domain-containing protein n=2 Tax=Triticum aestivum TaxID=4565 RepID=W5C3E7_WHEAT|nr:A-kinase anchor protein 17A-like [Triticum aestivum]SPT17167.1 unnamed protein product [Triticum aestivum]